jgi:hypothetical protein
MAAISSDILSCEKKKNNVEKNLTIAKTVLKRIIGTVKLFSLNNLDLAVLLRARTTFTLISLFGFTRLPRAKQFLLSYFGLATIHLL